jgi:hypothetical protein
MKTISDNPTQEIAGTRERAASATRPAPKPARLRHTPGGAALGKDAGHEARRLATAVLEVLAGLRTPSQAAEALGVSLPRYFQVETRAMQALLAGCEPRPRGPGRSADKELVALQREHERLQQELRRQQTLLRLAQRTIGLTPAKAPPDKPGAKDRSKKRQRRPVVRALRAAAVLLGRSQEVQTQEAASAAEAPQNHPEGKG